MTLRGFLLLACIAAGAASARADSYLVFEDDRAGFQSALDGNPGSTVIDTGGAFAPDPGSAASVASVTRTGTVAGGTFTYTIYDLNFAASPTGTITPGSVGGDVASTSTIAVESPASQNGGVGLGTWGVDSAGGGNTTRNALLLDFTATPGGLGIGHFGLDLIDFEIPSGSLGGALRLYDGGVLVFSHTFDWSPQNGSGQRHFLGVVAVDGSGPRFDQAMLVVGGNTDNYAADRFTFGAAVHNPEPGTLALFGLGALGLLAWRRRLRASLPACRSPPTP